MGGYNKTITHTFHIKNMVCNCCIILLKEKFGQAGILVNNIQLGTVTVTGSPTLITDKYIDDFLGKYGFELIKDREFQLIEQIKIAVIELIHHLNNVDSIVRKSDYLLHMNPSPLKNILYSKKWNELKNLSIRMNTRLVKSPL